MVLIELRMSKLSAANLQTISWLLKTKNLPDTA